MDSPQSVVSPFKNFIVSNPEKQKSDVFARNLSSLSKGTEITGNKTIGVLEVYIDQARDIHNICIYHKQDVYAKLCLTGHPANSVSTKIINGGGRNPIFNENLQLKVQTIDSSLKCEIWMLSRVKNYLEDQLLGLALVPLSEVLIKNGKLEREFALSSTDLFHSPAGFVHLSLSYLGACPDVLAIPPPLKSLATEAVVQDSEGQESLPTDFDNIEFPDPKIEKENECMVTEYFGIASPTVETQGSECLVTSDAGNHVSSEAGIRTVENFSAANVESPPSRVSTNGVTCPDVISSEESELVSKSPNQEQVSSQKEKSADVEEGESDSSGGVSSKTRTKPVFTINVEPEQNMVQQDIVDMYMKSMQQFTESLAKMKLPLDIDNRPTNSGNSSSEKAVSPKNSSSRVFYGSRAFF